MSGKTCWNGNGITVQGSSVEGLSERERYNGAGKALRDNRKRVTEWEVVRKLERFGVSILCDIMVDFRSMMVEGKLEEES